MGQRRPERLKVMAREGRRRAEENFSWIKLGQRLEDWLLRMSTQ